VHAKPTGKKSAGWVFFDGECSFCAGGVKLLGDLFARRGFIWVPLQSPVALEKLGSAAATMRDEMKLLLADGRIVGGVDAWVILFRSVRWLSPLGFLLSLRGFHWFGERVYGWIAQNRKCLKFFCGGEACETHKRHRAFFEIP
jgi:predicted DCC family thiol-disulfide oxidoreductase YuxK